MSTYSLKNIQESFLGFSYSHKDSKASDLQPFGRAGKSSKPSAGKPLNPKLGKALGVLAAGATTAAAIKGAAHGYSKNLDNIKDTL